MSKHEGQEPESQLLHLREHRLRMGWSIVGEHVDTASAADLRGPVQWRGLLERIRKGGLDAVVVTRLDRAFRSSKNTYDNLAYLDSHKVGFVAITQPIDTTTATGKLLLGVLAAVAEFERTLIRERTQDGLARARAEGKCLGRPPGAKDTRRRKKSGYFKRWAGQRESAQDVGV
ncbi:MAG: recombinase family protein [Chloroflexota bacterium]